MSFFLHVIGRFVSWQSTGGGVNRRRPCAQPTATTRAPLTRGLARRRHRRGKTVSHKIGPSHTEGWQALHENENDFFFWLATKDPRRLRNAARTRLTASTGLASSALHYVLPRLADLSACSAKVDPTERELTVAVPLGTRLMTRGSG